MFITLIVLSTLFAASFVMSSVSKFRRDPQQLEHMRELKFQEKSLSILGTIELCAAFGLMAGLFWWPIGLAASIGSVLFFTGAIVFQLRVGDTKIQPASVYLLFAIAVLIVRILSI